MCEKIDDMKSFCIRSYHIYKEIWEAAAGEVLMCERETHNGML